MKKSKKKKNKIFEYFNTGKIRENWHILVLVGIFIVALVLRFYNFENRWGLAYDQARDALVVREALRLGEFPLIGPFSASGPFVFGPLWYWVFMGVTLLYPGSVITPWVFQGVISAAMVIPAYFIGKLIHGIKFGLLLSLLIAVSTAQIAQSTNLAYSTFVGFISVFTFLLFVRFIKYRKSIDLFFLSFVIAAAVNIHFQAIGLLFLLPIIAVFIIKNPKQILLATLAFVLPFTPIIIFDFISDHYQSRNLSEYFLLGKTSAPIVKRWLTYAGTFWPQTWSHVIGGNIYVGYVIITFGVIVAAYKLLKKEIALSVFLIGLFFTVNFLVLRYYKGMLFDAFFVYLHLPILLLTAWTISSLYKKSKLAASLLLFVILTGTMIKNHAEITEATNLAAQKANVFKTTLYNRFPGENFDLYDEKYKHKSSSFPLALFLLVDGRLSEEGRKIGISGATVDAPQRKLYPLVTEVRRTGVYDLSSSSSAELAKDEWGKVSASENYNSTVEWYKNSKEL